MNYQPFNLVTHDKMGYIIDIVYSSNGMVGRGTQCDIVRLAERQTMGTFAFSAEDRSEAGFAPQYGRRENFASIRSP